MFGGTHLLPGALGRVAFRRIWFGIMLSRIGDQFAVVALMWFVLGLSGAGTAGLVLASFGVPALVSGPVAGRLLDHFHPRVVMASDNLCRAGLVALMPVLRWTGALRLWEVCLIACACGLLSPVTEVGESTLVPELVPDEELEGANSLVSVNWEVAALVGPPGAGALVGLIGAPATLLADSASFLAMGGIMLTMPAMNRGRTEDAPEPARRAFRRAFMEMLEGFTLLVRMKAVGFLTLITVVVLFLEGVREVLIPVYGREVLGAGASGYGLMLSAVGTGSLLGLLVLGPPSRGFSSGAALAGILMLGGLLFAPLAFVGSLPAALAVLFVAGFALAPFYVVNRSARQRLVPEGLRGRVFGAGSSLGATGFPLGIAAGGFLLVGFSAETVTVLSAMLMAVLGAMVLSVPALRGRTGPASRPGRNRSPGDG